MPGSRMGKNACSLHPPSPRQGLSRVLHPQFLYPHLPLSAQSRNIFPRAFAPFPQKAQESLKVFQSLPPGWLSGYVSRRSCRPAYYPQSPHRCGHRSVPAPLLCCAPARAVPSPARRSGL